MLGREGLSPVLITHVLLPGSLRVPESPETADGRSQEVFVHEMETITPQWEVLWASSRTVTCQSPATNPAQRGFPAPSLPSFPKACPEVAMRIPGA